MIHKNINKSLNSSSPTKQNHHAKGLPTRTSCVSIARDFARQRNSRAKSTMSEGIPPHDNDRTVWNHGQGNSAVAAGVPLAGWRPSVLESFSHFFRCFFFSCTHSHPRPWVGGNGLPKGGGVEVCPSRAVQWEKAVGHSSSSNSWIGSALWWKMGKIFKLGLMASLSLVEATELLVPDRGFSERMRREHLKSITELYGWVWFWFR